MLKQRLLDFLMMHAGEEYNQRQLAKALNVSEPAIMKAIDTKHIKVRRAYNQKLITLNDKQETIWLKRAYNLKLLATSGLLTQLKKKLPGITVILFGSFADGQDTNGSDIDLAFIGEKINIDLSSYETLLNRKIHVSHYDELRKINGHLRVNILNGITLHGHI
ncbi:nucleotidyltransferase domain-containing protein [Candidatus Woesearchaeota archaeon]|nr:nucleotidyltransferase domain-containing protein [Candidatus Woesearchaeota archaeon]